MTTTTLYRFLPLILLAGITGCGLMKHGANSKAMEPGEYLAWYGAADCPLRDTVTAKEVMFILEQVPVEVDLARNLRAGRMTAQEAQAAYAESKKVDELNYVMTVALPAAGKDIFSYNLRAGESGRKEYVSFGMKQDLFLITNTSDTIDCSHTLYEQGISNTPRSRFLIDFTAISREKVTQLVFRDRLWSGQTIIFDLKTNQQAVIPRLKL